MPLRVRKRGRYYHYSGSVAGRLLRGTTRTEDKATAERIAAEIEAREWKRRLDGPEAVTTFAMAAIEYRRAGKSDRFLDRVEDYWRDTPVRQITPGMIQKAARDIYPKGSPSTRNRQAITPTQAVINHAAGLGFCSPIRVERFKTTSKVRDHATLEWVVAFTSRARPRLSALVWFMFLTGARVSEAINLRWDDVDLPRSKAIIRQTKTQAERETHLPPLLVAAIANIKGHSRSDRVFGYKGRGSIRSAWRTACKRAGIETSYPHACRHGFATALVRDGVDLVTVARLGGWKSTALVARTYAHASRDDTLNERILCTKSTQSHPATPTKSRKANEN